MHLNNFYRACLAALAWVCLAGCADTHWERAFYQGAAYSTEQCQLKRKPSDGPCTTLPDYSSYERERTRAKNESPLSSQVNPIEDVQQ